jgi:uncharacterized protein (TIGR02611 family)
VRVRSRWNPARCRPLARKVAVGIAGFSVLAAGVALIFLPGPAIVVIPLGLAILAKEFPWAKRLLDRMRALVHPLWAGVRSFAARTFAARTFAARSWRRITGRPAKAPPQVMGRSASAPA